MTDHPDITRSELPELAEGIYSLSQVAWAFYIAQTLENFLANKLISTMVIPSNRFGAQLFEGYGPLSSFSAKIDIARALQIIDTETYNTLRILKSIRNKFAHPEGLPHFEDEAIAEECQKLPGYTDDGHSFSLFGDVAASIIIKIDDSKDAIKWAGILRAISAERKPSVKKSP